VKKITFKIAGKIGLGYGILTIAILLNAGLVIKAIVFSSDLNSKISKVYEPSVVKLNHLSNLVGNSQMLIRSWVFVDKIADTPDKLKLVNLHKTQYPTLVKEVNVVADDWDESTRMSFEKVKLLISDSLFSLQKEVMGSLRNMDDYDNAINLFMVVPMVSDQGEITVLTNRILSLINKLVERQNAEIFSARDDMEKSFVTLKNYIIFTSLALILVSIVIGLVTVRSLVKPINKIKLRLLWMSKGSLPESNMKVRSDEIGEMTQALNQLVGGLKAISGFALEIGRGNYQSSFTPLSDDDVLGNSLLHMRDDLHAASIEESKRKLEDQQRNWATAGIAKFSEILRQDNDKLDVLSFHIISNLVNYLDANQGGIFMVNEINSAELSIDLVSCYAYNRQKYIQKSLQMGEGLVGRCIQEKETIYLTDIPNDYIKLKSGLGEANPRCLLLVPLIMNTDVFGVIEIASFTDIQKYQIEFVEKIAESIASTLKAVRINMRTSKLLEQSRIQTEELASQEEEMRQNMEELRATQEQSFRKEKELQKTVEDLQHKLGDSD
jgi:methyl-accepting chemotaxis protein